MAYQKIIIRGNLGADPELRNTPSGNNVVNFSVAVGEKWTDKATNTVKDHTEWFRCVAFGKTADVIAQYFSKGSGILVEGKLRTQKYQDKNTGEDKYSVQLIVGSFDFIDIKGDSQPRQQAPQASQQGAQPAAEGFDDDIPFSAYMRWTVA